MESPYSSDPPDYEKWPCPESFPDLASVREELDRLETVGQVFNQHLRDAEGQEGARPSSGEASLGNDEPSLTQQDGWSDVAQRLKQQQAGLESRAAYLSRRPTSGACLANLSTEILVMIIKYFEYTPNYEDTGRQGVIAEFPEEDRRTIQALRLTSRRLNLLASPFLMPIVKLSVDTTSLSLARDLWYRPHIAAGIQAIRVGLENRPADPIKLPTFLDLKEPELGSLGFDVKTEYADVTLLLFQSYHSEQDFHHSEQDSYHSEQDETVRELRIASSNMYEAIDEVEMVRSAVEELKKDQVEAWKARLEGRLASVRPDVDPVTEDRVSRYKRLITLAHEEYGRIQKQQKIIIQRRFFVGMVALLASKGRKPISLEFFERRRYRPGTDPSITRTPYRSNQALFEFLLDAPDWGNPAHPVSISVLHDLPIAIRNTGRILNGLQISCPPMIHQMPSIYSDDQPNNAWDEFSAAAQELKFLSLEKRQFKGDLTGDQTIAASGRRGICKYFTGLLSGHRFEEVSFDGSAYRNQMVSNLGSQFPIGQAFANIAWPHIKTVRIFHVSMTQAELEGFVRGLGTNLEEIILHNVLMRGGTWMLALDILKERVARRPQGALGFHVPHLLGDVIDRFVRSGDELLVQHFERSNTYTAMKLMERYVNNDGISENPLRVH